MLPYRAAGIQIVSLDQKPLAQGAVWQDPWVSLNHPCEGYSTPKLRYKVSSSTGNHLPLDEPAAGPASLKNMLNM